MNQREDLQAAHAATSAESDASPKGIRAGTLLVLDHFDCLGGAEACLLDQMVELGRRGRTMMATRARDARVASRLSTVPGLNVLPLFPYLTRRNITPARAADIASLRRASAGCGVILCNSFPALLTGALLRRKGQSLFFQCHRVDLTLFQRRLLRLAAPDLVLAVSASSRDYLLTLDLPPDRIMISGNGFHLEGYPELPLPGANVALPLCVGLVGRLHREKGVEDFIALAKRLAGRHDLRFVLAGPLVDPALKPLLEQLEQTGVLPNLECRAFRDKPWDIYGYMDLVVSISRVSESFGRTLVEAALLGRPAVALAGSGPDEIISSERTGFLVRNPKELDALLIRLTKDRILLGKLGSEARREAVGCYDIRTVADRLEFMLDSILRPSSKRPTVD